MSARPATLRERLAGSGMLGVLVLLCVLFSALTLKPQQATGERAARRLAERLLAETPPESAILVLARGGAEDERFVEEAARRLREGGRSDVAKAAGDPAVLRAALERLAASAAPQRHVAAPASAGAVVHAILDDMGRAQDVRAWVPEARRWPTFLLKDNLLNVASQIAVIAIIAIGMTLVIVAGGIDLSAGSLVALSAVVVAWCVGRLGGAAAGSLAVILAAAAAIAACAACGAFSGLVVTRFRIPPFIATLAMMQVASGAAYLISRGKPIHELPPGFERLGRGTDPWLGLPLAVLLMLALYALAHGLLERTVFGRHVRAVGGNAEAARLAGVPVKAVLLATYTACGALAGLGGVLMASQLRSGAPTYGASYELHVIAAVVVGGTSLSGGEGRMTGTLVGALIMGVIQNGMNLLNIESYTQKVVLGLVILGAVLVDRLRERD